MFILGLLLGLIIGFIGAFSMCLYAIVKEPELINTMQRYFDDLKRF